MGNDQISAILKTLISYSINESIVGEATQIRLNFYDSQFEITDNGRGHSLAKNVAGIPYLDLVYQQFGVLENADDIPPVQIHTLGMTLITNLVKGVHLTVKRDGVVLKNRYEYGSLTSSETSDYTGADSGNTLLLEFEEQLQAIEFDIRQFVQRVSKNIKHLSVTISSA